MKSPSYGVAIAQKFSGDENVIVIPKLYIEMTGSYTAAAMLNQLLYWFGKMKNKPFYKTDEDLGNELCVSAKTISRNKSALEPLGITTKRLGIPARSHYFLDVELLENKLGQYVRTVADNMSELETDNMSELIQKNKQKTTQKTTTVKDIPSSKNQDLVHPTPNNLLDNPYYTAWNENCGQLPLVTSNKEADKLIRRELKTKSKADLVEAITQGARVVSQDSFWLERRYGLVNLLRHLDSKVEVSKDGRSGANAKVQSLATGIYGALND